MTAYIVGVVCWFIDFLCCPTMNVYLPAIGIPNPQLHAWYVGHW